MKVNTSYEVRGRRIPTSMSYPDATERNRQDALKHIAWVIQQEKPQVEISYA